MEVCAGPIPARMDGRVPGWMGWILRFRGAKRRMAVPWREVGAGPTSARVDERVPGWMGQGLRDGALALRPWLD